MHHILHECNSNLLCSQIFPADHDTTTGDALGPVGSSSTGPGSSKNDSASYSAMVSSSLDPCCSTSSLDDFTQKKTISKKRNSCHEIVVNKRFRESNDEEGISSWKTLERFGFKAIVIQNNLIL